MFKPDFTSPTLLKASPATAIQDYHLLWSGFPARSRRNLADPVSLGATNGVAVAFLSSSY